VASFSYRAWRADGSVSQGQLEAASRQEALAMLGRQGLQALALDEGRAGAAVAARRSASRRVPAAALEAFTRQLASLLAAGIPLAQGLHLLAHEGSAGRGRATWQAVHDDVVDGTSLAQAMGHCPEVFPQVYCAMVKAGETGGFLDLVLSQIADFQSRERELRSRLLGALIYPAVLAALASAVVVFLMVFFIPRFEGMFQDFGAALPPLTRAIVSASRQAQRWGLPVMLAAVALVVALRRYLVGASGRLQADRLMLRLPLAGGLVARLAMTRFCRMLGTLTQAGVPLVGALRVARESIANRVLGEAVTRTIDAVQHGDRLGASLAGCPELFPSTVVAMVNVAEQSGRLGPELVRLADEAEKDLDRRLRTAVALAEPALLFVMAAVVGVIVVGMVLPIFAIQEYIQ